MGANHVKFTELTPGRVVVELNFFSMIDLHNAVDRLFENELADSVEVKDSNGTTLVLKTWVDTKDVDKQPTRDKM